MHAICKHLFTYALCLIFGGTAFTVQALTRTETFTVMVPGGHAGKVATVSLQTTLTEISEQGITGRMGTHLSGELTLGSVLPERPTPSGLSTLAFVSLQRLNELFQDPRGSTEFMRYLMNILVCAQKGLSFTGTFTSSFQYDDERLGTGDIWRVTSQHYFSAPKSDKEKEQLTVIRELPKQLLTTSFEQTDVLLHIVIEHTAPAIVEAGTAPGQAVYHLWSVLDLNSSPRMTCLTHATGGTYLQIEPTLSQNRSTNPWGRPRIYSLKGLFQNIMNYNQPKNFQMVQSLSPIFADHQKPKPAVLPVDNPCSRLTTRGEYIYRILLSLASLVINVGELKEVTAAPVASRFPAPPSGLSSGVLPAKPGSGK